MKTFSSKAKAASFYLAMLVVVWHSPLMACDCQFSEISADAVRSAGVVLIGKVRNAQLSAQYDRHVVGEIEVVRTLVGEISGSLGFSYSTVWCCGSRIEVGSYYLVFTNSTDDLFLHHGNTLHLGITFSADEIEIDRIANEIARIRSGTQDLSNLTRPGYGRVHIDGPHCADDSKTSSRYGDEGSGPSQKP